VDVYIARLRQKLAEAIPGCPYIHTHFGFGYRLSPE
jgi:DNA-binding response OmpR family regulator